MQSKRLVTRYVMQNGVDANYGYGDCGFAGIAEVAQTVGINVSPDNVIQIFNNIATLADLPPGFTSAHITKHLEVAAAQLGINFDFNGNTTAAQIKNEINNHHTVLLRVWYPGLQKRRLRNYNDWHFITVTGWEVIDGVLYFYYDDPEWFSASEGEDIRIEASALVQATRYNSQRTTPGQALFLRSHRLPERAS